MKNAPGRTALGVALVLGLVIWGCSDEEAGKKKVNEDCQGNADCADHICYSGICVGANPGGDGARCSGAGECRSLLCVGGICKAGVQPDGAACLFDEECAGRICVGGKCSGSGIMDGGSPDGPPLDMSVPDLPLADQSIADKLVIPDKAPKPDICLNESPTQFCKRLKKECGLVTAKNNCNLTQTVNCGGCTASKICGGDPNLPNSCNLCKHPTVTSVTFSDSYGEWGVIPKGCFTMGSPATEICRSTNAIQKEVQHKVVLSHKFWLSLSEVTQAQFDALMGYNPSGFNASSTPSCTTKCPVEKVSWHEAAAFCNALSAKAGKTPCYEDKLKGKGKVCSPTVKCGTGEVCFKIGKTGTKRCREYKVAATYSGKKFYDCPGYRLPTEAEWEYAYRAGDMTTFYKVAGKSTGTISSCNGDANAAAIGWYVNNSGGSTKDVKTKPANNWGLHDMAGNVWEWVQDRLEAYPTTATTNPVVHYVSNLDLNIVRGGSHSNNAATLRAAVRWATNPWQAANNWGFRVAISK